MTTPQILLGYSKAELSGVPGMLQASVVNVPQIRSNIFVTLFVHLEPTIVMPMINTTFLESTETPAVTVCLFVSIICSRTFFLFMLDIINCACRLELTIG